jgi:hypothetical protein
MGKEVILGLEGAESGYQLGIKPIKGGGIWTRGPPEDGATVRLEFARIILQGVATKRKAIKWEL